MNEKELISEVFHSTPAGQIQLVVKDLPTAYVTKLLTFISETMAKSKHMEFCLLWLLHTFNHHGDYLKDNSSSFMSLLRDLQKNCSVHYDALAPMYAIEIYLRVRSLTFPFSDAMTTPTPWIMCPPSPVLRIVRRQQKNLPLLTRWKRNKQQPHPPKRKASESGKPV